MTVYAMITTVMGLVGAVLAMALTAHEPLTFAGTVWTLALLLALLGLYSAWAMRGGKM